MGILGFLAGIVIAAAGLVLGVMFLGFLIGVLLRGD